MPELKPSKPRVLLQLDIDPHPSVFDAVVAIDSGVDHLLRHGSVRPEAVRDLVHGLLFTRGGDDLRRSAIFVGGSDIEAGEAVVRAAVAACFGPFRVAIFHDSNGSNTTAAAVVLAIGRSLGSTPTWRDTPVAVVGAGPVGARVARLLGSLGAPVRLGSPDPGQAAAVVAAVGGPVEAFRIDEAGAWREQVGGVAVLVAAGPAGVEILPGIGRDRFPDLRVAIDLNAVPPHGLGATKPTDADHDRAGVRVWGALGVGGLKMKIHKAVIRAMFDAEPTVYDVEQVFEVARRLDSAPS